MGMIAKLKCALRGHRWETAPRRKQFGGPCGYSEWQQCQRCGSMRYVLDCDHQGCKGIYSSYEEHSELSVATKQSTSKN